MAASNAYCVAPDGGLRLSTMIVDVDRQTLSTIRNSDLRLYAVKYIDISEDFMAQVRSSGIEIDPDDYKQETATRIDQLRQRGGIFRNSDKSIYLNQISPACVACQKGVGSETFFISLKCHRSCFYCFNPNQEGYDHFSDSLRDLPQELQQRSNAGHQLQHLALTGGEPLLHPKEAIEFFRQASDSFPDAFNRLYTTGDQLDAELLRQLRDAGLDEIRFSIRMHDLEKGHRHTFDRIALAKNYIPHVMVEMPILPDTFEIMKDVLLELERLDVSSINLLEFCYPLNNAETYNRKGYKVKHRPYRVLYNYWYAGGLPIARSELVCLDLMLFALDAKLKMGVHYCSLENKHTGQLYQQNTEQRPPQNYYFSPNDYFLKTAKVFGADIRQTRKILRHQKSTPHNLKDTPGYLEFHVSQIDKLKGLNVEVGLSYNVFETRQGEPYLRELKLSLVKPETFDLTHDA